MRGSPECERILNALEVYGTNKIDDEIKYCVDQLLQICSLDQPAKLRDLVFAKRTTNAFPSVFAVILIAIHEIIVGQNKKIANHSGVRKALDNLSERIDTSRKATSSEERRKNIDTVKGLIGGCVISEMTLPQEIYGNHTTVDVEDVIRRSEIELGNYELKQGLLTVAENGGVDPNIPDKVVKTICAIANIGPNSMGKILIGVTDKPADAERINKIDRIESKKVGKRFVVGVNREAKRMGISVQQYFAKWRDNVKNSQRSEDLRNDVLSNMDFNSFYGFGVIVITVPSQASVSYVGDELYWRNGASTELAILPKQIAAIAGRF